MVQFCTEPEWTAGLLGRKVLDEQRVAKVNSNGLRAVLDLLVAAMLVSSCVHCIHVERGPSQLQRVVKLDIRWILPQ